MAKEVDDVEIVNDVKGIRLIGQLEGVRLGIHQSVLHPPRAESSTHYNRRSNGGISTVFK